MNTLKIIIFAGLMTPVVACQMNRSQSDTSSTEALNPAPDDQAAEAAKTAYDKVEFHNPTHFGLACTTENSCSVANFKEVQMLGSTKVIRIGDWEYVEAGSPTKIVPIAFYGENGEGEPLAEFIAKPLPQEGVTANSFVQVSRLDAESGGSPENTTFQFHFVKLPNGSEAVFVSIIHEEKGRPTSKMQVNFFANKGSMFDQSEGKEDKSGSSLR